MPASAPAMPTASQSAALEKIATRDSRVAKSATAAEARSSARR
jgi:hypothetical protein